MHGHERSYSASQLSSSSSSSSAMLRFTANHANSSAFSPSANPNEDWTKISDLAERRRIQNRIAQRNYRKKLKRRLEDLERRAASASASPEPEPRSLSVGPSSRHGTSPRLAPPTSAGFASSPEPEPSYGSRSASRAGSRPGSSDAHLDLLALPDDRHLLGGSQQPSFSYSSYSSSADGLSYPPAHSPSLFYGLPSPGHFHGLATPDAYMPPSYLSPRIAPLNGSTAASPHESTSKLDYFGPEATAYDYGFAQGTYGYGFESQARYSSDIAHTATHTPELSLSDADPFDVLDGSLAGSPAMLDALVWPDLHSVTSTASFDAGSPPFLRL